MKKTIALLLALALCVTLCACGKSEAVKAAEEAIAAIGEVTVDSGEAIANAEKLFAVLTEAEKAEVDNRMTLVDAQEQFKNVTGEIIYQDAKSAYEKLKKAGAVCTDGMNAIYGAAHFGIYEADDASNYVFGYELSLKVPGLSSEPIEAAMELLSENMGIEESLLIKLAKSDWSYCVYIVQTALATRGDYDTVNTNVEEAEALLKGLTEKYEDDTYYPKLKEYYTAVKSYADFFNSPSGTVSQISETSSNYENQLRALESDLDFLLNQ